MSHSVYLELQFQQLRFEGLALCHCHCKLKIRHKSNNVGRIFFTVSLNPPSTSQARLGYHQTLEDWVIRFCSTIISWWSKLNIHERVELSLTMAMKVTIRNRKEFCRPRCPSWKIAASIWKLNFGCFSGCVKVSKYGIGVYPRLPSISFQ